MSAKRAFGVVVRIVQLSTTSPRGSVHLSHSPANAKTSPSPTSEAVGLLALAVPSLATPCVESVRRNQTPLRDLNGSRNERYMVVTVSGSCTKFIVRKPMVGSFAQEGTSPHRMVEKLRRGLEGSWRIDRTGCEGAMLYRGASSYSP